MGWGVCGVGVCLEMFECDKLNESGCKTSPSVSAVYEAWEIYWMWSEHAECIWG